MPKLDFNPIIKPAGGNCNCACGYCFYGAAAGSDAMMSHQTLTRVVSEVARVAARPAFSWQGGEPTLLGMAFFEKAIALQKEAFGGKVPSNAFQTNGILIDGTWATFLKDNDFLVGLSLDGPRDIHNAVRSRPGGQGTFDDVMRAAQRLRNHGAQFNILCVVGKHNVGEAERLWRFFRSGGFDFLQFIPCLQHSDQGEVLLPQSPTADELGGFYCRLFDCWFEEARAGRIASVRIFDNALGILMGQPPTTCLFAPNCSNQIVIDADGSVYACDWYVLPDWRLGSIMETDLDALLECELNKRFRENSAARSQRCDRCRYLRLCFGGCPLHRTVRDDGENYFCDAYIKLYDHAVDGLLEVAKTIYAHRQREHPPGRQRARPNDPCPCGSGRKFKKCCGRA